MAGLEYKVEDRSILLPLYKRLLIQPFVPHIPARIHPNAITHFGHALNLVTTLFLWVVGIEHPWACVLAMLGLQLYTWCDNADGAHARRTGQASTYGEFLDHGLDQLNTTYIGMLTAIALGASPSWFVASVLLTSGAAAVTYWEQSVTGVFRLGLLNQVESVMVLSLVLVLGAIFGPTLWAHELVPGVSVQLALLGWMTITIIVGSARAMLRVLPLGLSKLTPVALFIGVSALDLGLTIAGLVPWWAGFAFAFSMNAYCGMRMLSQRLSKELPAVEPMVLVSALVLSAAIALPRLGVASPAKEALLVLAAVFVLLGLRETRRGLAKLAAMAALCLVVLPAHAGSPRCKPRGALEGAELTRLGPLERLDFPRSKDAPVLANATTVCTLSPSGAARLGWVAPLATSSAADAWVRRFEQDTVLERPWPVLEAMAAEGARITVPARLGTGVLRAAGVARATVLEARSDRWRVIERSYRTSGETDLVLAELARPNALPSSLPLHERAMRGPTREELERASRVVGAIEAAVARANAELAPGDRAASSALAAQGLALHRARRHAEAVAALERAVAADPTHGQAHYDLARALAAARAAKLACRVGATKARILEELELALLHLPGKHAKLLAEPELAPVRDTYGFLRLAGSARDPRRTLLALSWYAPPTGAFGPRAGLRFRPNGRYEAWVKVVDDAGVRVETSRGAYRLEGPRVTLRPDVPQAAPLHGVLEEGRLRFGDDFGPFGDDPADCAA